MKLPNQSREDCFGGSGEREKTHQSFGSRVHTREAPFAGYFLLVMVNRRTAKVASCSFGSGRETTELESYSCKTSLLVNCRNS